MAVEPTLLVLLLILAVGLIVPEFLKRFRLPFITVIIILGALFGPSGLNYVPQNDVISFFGFLGMSFLMFMAGLETDISRLKKSKLKVSIMALFIGFIPFLVGLGMTRYFGYSWLTSILVGIVFISSSVAVIVSSLKDTGIFDKDFGQFVLAAVLIADIVSLIALGFIFQSIERITDLPLSLYYAFLLASVIVLIFFVPKVINYLVKKRFSRDDGHESYLRFFILIVVASLVYFSFLGVHPILAAFLTGLALSGIVWRDKSKILVTKLHTLGYGLFIPIFFFIVGTEMNLGLFREFDLSNVIMISLVFGLIFSKIGSGYIAGRIVKFTKKESLLFGAISIPQLTTTLAVTYAASALGLLDSVLVTSIIVLSVVTTLVGPLLVSYINGRKG